MFPQFVSIVLAAEGNNREKAEKRKGVFMLLDTLAYGLIPLVTVWFSRGYGWFSTNFSVIANEFEKQRGFFLWGLLVGICSFGLEWIWRCCFYPSKRRISRRLFPKRQSFIFGFRFWPRCCWGFWCFGSRVACTAGNRWSIAASGAACG